MTQQAELKKTAVEPSGAKDPSATPPTPDPAHVISSTPENRLGHLNPSAPEDANTTPGSTLEK